MTPICALRPRPRPTLPYWAVAAFFLAAAALSPLPAKAAGRYSSSSLVKRRGVQAEGMFGVSACMPGRASCRISSLERTGPLVGAELNLGVRPVQYFLIGAGYSVGFFDPKASSKLDSVSFSTAYQHTFVLVLRGIWPVGRFDFGFEASPGWSRQRFRADSEILVARDEYSQGFALRPGLSISVWLTNSLFLGVKADTIVNIHSETCTRLGETTMCRGKLDPDRASVHQFLAGVHLGGTF